MAPPAPGPGHSRRAGQGVREPRGGKFPDPRGLAVIRAGGRGGVRAGRSPPQPPTGREAPPSAGVGGVPARVPARGPSSCRAPLGRGPGRPLPQQGRGPRAASPPLTACSSTLALAPSLPRGWGLHTALPFTFGDPDPRRARRVPCEPVPLFRGLPWGRGASARRVYPSSPGQGDSGLPMLFFLLCSPSGSWGPVQP